MLATYAQRAWHSLPYVTPSFPHTGSIKRGHLHAGLSGHGHEPSHCLVVPLIKKNHKYSHFL